MASYSTRRPSRAPLLRAARVVLTAAVILTSPVSPVRADVSAEGDVAPTTEIDVDGETITIPNLPTFGGEVGDGTSDANVIVGGTGITFLPEPIPNIGRVIVDTPGNTAPVESTNLYIAGAPQGLPGQTGTGGTQLISGSSIGLVSVTGFFSEWRLERQLVVGGFGEAYLELTAGALLTTGNPLVSSTIRDGYVGGNEGSQGYVAINGFGSRLNNGQLTVGFRGFGRVDVTNRGTLFSRSGAVLGDRAVTVDGDLYIGNGSVYVDGLGSRWNVGDINGIAPSDDLVIGNQGQGRVEVRNAGVVRVDRDTRLGVSAGSFGEILVNGRDSLFWTFEDLTAGENAAAIVEMHVENEGKLRADGVTTIGAAAIVDLATGGVMATPNLTNNGVIRGDGRIEAGTTLFPLVNNKDIRNGAGVANLRERLLFTGPLINNDNIESVGGEMEFQGLVTNAGLDSEIVGIDAIFRFTGGLINAGRFLLDNTLVETLGGPAPITSNAEMAVFADDQASTIAGNLVLGGANVLGMQLGALNFSRLQISGTATLGGMLDISGVSGYLPQLGDQFEIITASTVAGAFVLPVTDDISGFDFTVTYDSDRVILNTVGGFVFDADFDGNGIVDGGDFLTWQFNYGAVVPPGTAGDANGDGVVNDDDYDVWEDQFGSAPAAPVVAGVPEPAAGALALLALALPLWRKRR